MDHFLSLFFIGIPVKTWVVSLSYMVGGIVVGFVIAWIFRNILKHVFARTRTRLDDLLLSAIGMPVVVIVALIGIRRGVDVLTVLPGVAPWLDKTISVLIVLAVTRAAQKFLDGAVEEYLVPYVRKTEGDLDDQLLPLVRKIANFFVWVIGILIALREAGYDIGALLAGLGIGGVAIALAAKDTLSNLFGSVAVFVDKPFKINDRVKISGYDGFVTEIGVRTSRLRTLDGHVVTLPNAAFASGAIENISAETSTRISRVIQLETTVGYQGALRAIEILKEVGESGPGLAKGAIAALTDFGESSFDVTFVFFIAKGADYFGTISAVHLEVLRRFEEAKLPLAFPTRVMIERTEAGNEAGTKKAAKKSAKKSAGRPKAGKAAK